MGKFEGSAYESKPGSILEILHECMFPLGWTYSITQPNPEFKGKKQDIGATVELAMSPSDVSLLELVLLVKCDLKKGVALRLPRQAEIQDYPLDIDDVRSVKPYDGNCSGAPHLPRTAYFLRLNAEQPVIVLDGGRIQVNAVFDQSVIDELSLIPDPFDALD